MRESNIFAVDADPSGSSTDRLCRIERIIRERCILTQDDAWLVSTHGRDYAWLIDMRQAFLRSDALALICEEFWGRYEHLLPFQLGGLEISAIPLVVGLTMTAYRRGQNINGFILRKERKPSGVGKILEGEIGPEPIFIVDDIFNSASSLEKVRVVLASFGKTIGCVFTVIDYHSLAGSAWKEKQCIPVESLFSLSDFGLADRRSPPPGTLDLRTVWRFKSPSANHFYVLPKSAPIVSKGRVIVGSDRGTLWARAHESPHLS